jgi:hypothetical protein
LEGSGTAIDKSSSNSEPARATKRRKRTQDNKDLSRNFPCSSLNLGNRRLRKAVSISQVEDLPLDFGGVVDDSFEGGKRNGSDSRTRIQVEIPVCQNFDRDAYLRVLCPPPQATLTTESRKSSHTPAINKQQRVAKYDGEGIIPDSQELPGSVTAWTSLDTRPDTIITGGQILRALRSPTLEVPESPQSDLDIRPALGDCCDQSQADYHLETCYSGRSGREIYSSKEPLLLSSEGNQPDTRRSSSEELPGQKIQSRGTLKRHAIFLTEIHNNVSNYFQIT